MYVSVCYHYHMEAKYLNEILVSYITHYYHLESNTFGIGKEEKLKQKRGISESILENMAYNRT